ncbi:MAG TPA: glycerol-3-phosphate acyltransferase [Mobilitalea sp.]|nr:glycerol-3-phosphate acyltransferase [Mobilitalea sp.]
MVINMIRYIIYALIGFLSGSILYSHLITKLLYSVDITQVSDDGNPGSSNVFKYVDMKCGIISLLLDILKGIIPIYIAVQNLDTMNPFFALVLAAPVLGHALSPFLHFHGGKAIAVSFGCLLGLIPNSFIVFVLAILFILFSYIVSIKPDRLRSIIVFLLFAIYCFFIKAEITTIRYGCILIATVVIYKHIRAYDHTKKEFHIILLDRWLHHN